MDQHLHDDPGVQMAPGGLSKYRDTNLGTIERLASAIGGGLLALYGLRRGDTAGLLLGVGGGYMVYRGMSGHCPLYDTLGMRTAERHGDATSVAAGHGVRVDRSVTINAPADQLYSFWRDLKNLPRFMDSLESVTVDGDRSHWVARGPLGYRAEWDAKINNEKPGELIAWQSLEGGDIDTAGSVHFKPAPGGRGTEVRVEMKYDPPAGKAGAAVAKLFGRSADGQLSQALGRLKQIMETGEVARA